MAQKQTHAVVEYRAGNPIHNCGLCKMFKGTNNCTLVKNPISPYGLCDSYAAQHNPFQPAQRRAMRNMNPIGPPVQQ